MSILQERMTCKSGFDGLLKAWFRENFWNNEFKPTIYLNYENNWNVVYRDPNVTKTLHIVGYIRRDADGGIFMDIMPEHADKFKRDN